MKRIILILTAISLLLLCSCGKETPDNSQNESASATAAQSAAQTESAENSKTKELENRIAELEEKIKKMETFFNLEYKDGEYAFKNGRNPFSDDEIDEPHEEYDDAPVVNAYLSGDPSSLEGKDKEVFDLASAIIKDVIKDGMSSYEKELAVFDWITQNVTYDSEELAAIPAASVYSHLPYGALKYHRAICVGYATTFKLFMDMLQIENKLVHMTEEGEHAWNLVKLGDGWYHVDATFNTSDDDVIPYSEFNLTEQAIKENGYFVQDGSFPVASAVEFNYYYINGTKMSVNELKPYVKQWIASGGEGVPGIILTGTYSDDKISSILESASDGAKEGYGIQTTPLCRADGFTVFGMRYCLIADDDTDDDDTEYDDDYIDDGDDTDNDDDDGMDYDDDYIDDDTSEADTSESTDDGRLPAATFVVINGAADGDTSAFSESRGE